MSLKVDDINTFKKHRNEISESLVTKFVGRGKEIDDIYDLLVQKGFVAIIGSAGVGKSRLSVEVIEKYASLHKNVIVLCMKSFGDYISAIEEAIEDSKEYLVFIDDANNYTRLVEVIECLKYHKENVKAIFTVRNYLKDCVDDSLISFYEICALSDEEIKTAIIKNTSIRNEKWLRKILSICKGNIRIAFVVSNVALNDPRGFFSLFNVKDVMDSYYKNQIAKISNSENLVITAGIISFFKSIYLKQLFYILPVLKIASISKQEFLRCTDVLLSLELVDECFNVVKISDQCFADFLLNYVFFEKKYIKVKDLIVYTYKYYKKRIIESINSILNTCFSDDSFLYFKNEVLDSCSLVEDIGLKHDIEVTFANLILDNAALEFKKGVEDVNYEKDIDWLLGLFQVLAKSKYQLVANDGIIYLLKKTQAKKENVIKAINETYSLDFYCVKSSFEYLDFFVSYLIEHEIYEEYFLTLVSSYLKYSFENGEFVSGKKIEVYSFRLSDDMDRIIAFRAKCWKFIFSYDGDAPLSIIVDFARNHIIDCAQKIVKCDLEVINKYLNEFERKELIHEILYEELKEEAKNYGFESMLFPSDKYSDILGIILEKNYDNLSYDAFKKKHENSVRNFYAINKANLFRTLKDIEWISSYYSQEIKEFLLIILESLDEFTLVMLDVFIQYKICPRSVVEKLSIIIGVDSLYNVIERISDKSVKNEYLFAFYSFVSSLDINNTFGFATWIKSKQNLNIEPQFSRKVCSLRKIAEKSGIEYKKLIKIIFRIRVYNKSIAKEYLSYFFFDEDAFRELVNLDRKLAISIYEFLIPYEGNGCGYSALKEIIRVKRSYIKTFVERYLQEDMMDGKELEEFVFGGNMCKLFFDTCIEMSKEKTWYSVPITFQRFISNNLHKQEMCDWIFDYIEKRWKDDKTMEFLFSILSGIDTEYRNCFILKYYEKGKNENVLKKALLSACECYSLASAEIYCNSKIKGLESLKESLVKWQNMNLVSFINGLIEEYKKEIVNCKVSQLIEHVDQDILIELQEKDLTTEVSLSDAFRLYMKDGSFRRTLSSGFFTYQEGGFVAKSGESLKFSDVIQDKKIIGIEVVPICNEKNIDYEQFLSSMKEIRKKFQEGNQATLVDCLSLLFDERGWSAAEFGQETAQTRDLFSKIKKKQRKNFKKKTLVQILIGLRLPKYVREFLLEKNGTPFSIYDEDDVLYDFILASGIDIDTADKLLKNLGKEGFINEFEA